MKKCIYCNKAGYLKQKDDNFYYCQYCKHIMSAEELEEFNNKTEQKHQMLDNILSNYLDFDKKYEVALSKIQELEKEAENSKVEKESCASILQDVQETLNTLLQRSGLNEAKLNSVKHAINQLGNVTSSKDLEKIRQDVLDNLEIDIPFLIDKGCIYAAISTIRRGVYDAWSYKFHIPTIGKNYVISVDDFEKLKNENPGNPIFDKKLEFASETIYKNGKEEKKVHPDFYNAPNPILFFLSNIKEKEDAKKAKKFFGFLSISHHPNQRVQEELDEYYQKQNLYMKDATSGEIIKQNGKPKVSDKKLQKHLHEIYNFFKGYNLYSDKNM